MAIRSPSIRHSILFRVWRIPTGGRGCPSRGRCSSQVSATVRPVAKLQASYTVAPVGSTDAARGCWMPAAARLSRGGDGAGPFLTGTPIRVSFGRQGCRSAPAAFSLAPRQRSGSCSGRWRPGRPAATCWRRARAARTCCSMRTTRCTGTRGDSRPSIGPRPKTSRSLRFVHDDMRTLC